VKNILETYLLLLIVFALTTYAHMRGIKDKVEYCAQPLPVIEIIAPIKSLACWLEEVAND
jgi:hypothetical protein